MVNNSLDNNTNLWATLTLRNTGFGSYDGDWPYGFGNPSYNGYFGTSEQPVRGEIGIRPSITLRNGIMITKGDGTIGNPYVIK